MRGDVELAELRDQERFVEAGNAVADLVIYDLLSSWPPSNSRVMAAIRKVIDHYGHVLRPDQARGIVMGLVARELQLCDEVARWRAVEESGMPIMVRPARQPKSRVVRSDRGFRRAG
jgi:hypothetical protein